MPRQLLRLVVPSPDGRRVLARPNGLAGWTLPVVAVDDPQAWTDATAQAAARVVGTGVTAVRRIDERTWEVAPQGRIPAAGADWITVDEAARLGADADVVRRWAARRPEPLG